MDKEQWGMWGPPTSFFEKEGRYSKVEDHLAQILETLDLPRLPASLLPNTGDAASPVNYDGAFLLLLGPA